MKINHPRYPFSVDSLNKGHDDKRKNDSRMEPAEDEEGTSMDIDNLPSSQVTEESAGYIDVPTTDPNICSVSQNKKRSMSDNTISI